MTLNVQPIDDITLRGIQSFISFIVCIIFINNFSSGVHLPSPSFRLWNIPSGRCSVVGYGSRRTGCRRRFPRILLTGVGVGEHSFASLLSQVLAESGQLYLAVVIEVVRHVGGTGTGLVDGFVGRVEVEERFLSRVFFRLAVVPVQDDDALQQLVVAADQFLLQYPGAAARTEGYREPALAVDRIDAVIAGAHEENEKGGTGDVIRVLLVEYPSLFHEIVPSFRTFLQGVVFALDAGKQSDQFFRRVAYDAVDIHQALVRVIDHATDMRIGLSQSEERGAAPEKGFHIGFHFPDILRQ